MSEKTGVFICQCGANIVENLDTDALERHFAARGDALFAVQHGLLCSGDGTAFLKEQIQTQGLTRIVIGACSPRQHEHTFRAACRAAGMNPFLMQMANIREMCAWVSKDKEAATDKARAMLNGALERVLRHEPLETPEIAANPDSLVVGAGPAGMSAALLLAQKGRKVFLVEKAPCVGGMVVRYEDVFPNLDCAPCMLEPIMDEVLHHENIETLTWSEVADVKGFLGNFIVTVNKKARYVEPSACFSCAECFAACPVSVPNEYDEGLGQRKAIYWPFAGAMPNVPVIDTNACVRFTENKECTACADACGFGAIVYDQQDETVDIKVGAVVLATGFGLVNNEALAALGHGASGVLTTLEMERIISSTGPTGGELTINGKAPKRIAFIHCAGSRTKDTHNYCSGFCCMEALKLGHMARHKIEGAETVHFIRDLVLPGKTAQEFADKMIAEGAQFVRVDDPNRIKVQSQNGGLAVTCTDAAGKVVSQTFDAVVLAPAAVPGADAAHLSDLFQADCDAHGFFKESHNRMDAVATSYEGVMAAGCAAGPVDIQGATSAGKAAAGEILSAIVPGQKLHLTAVTAKIDDTKCTGCLMCNTMCPYKAIVFDGSAGVSRINEALCQGCGTCVAACPAAAIHNKHFSREQILAEIKGVLA
jgi:heterodisulfide reductase subunit A